MIGPKKQLEDSESARQDVRLVDRCRKGDASAWDELIDKYKNLIYSIPVKCGFTRDNANEIFQGVCLTLLEELENLREPRALAAWIITTTSRDCSRFLRQQGRSTSADESMLQLLPETGILPDQQIRYLEQEQMLRNALDALLPPCRRLVDLLFFTEPPIAYDEAASQLGMAKGSIGATRMRCLDKLRRLLEEQGLR